MYECPQSLQSVGRSSGSNQDNGQLTAPPVGSQILAMMHTEAAAVGALECCPDFSGLSFVAAIAVTACFSKENEYCRS